MSDVTLNCKACGKDFHFAKGYIDEAENTFCTLSCSIQIGRTTHCVSRFNLKEELAPEQFRNIFYTCDAVQLVTQTLKVGEKIDDDGKPEIHPTQTQIFLVLAGEGTATIFQDDKPFPMHLEAGGKDILIVPPRVPHIIENTGTDTLSFLIIYSPPVH